MALVIFVALLGFLAALGLKSVWYPVLAILATVNLVMYVVAFSVHGPTDTTLLMLASLFMTLFIAGFHLLFVHREGKEAPRRALKARLKSYNEFFSHRNDRDPMLYQQWCDQTANEWWRQYPGRNGKMDAVMVNDPFTVEVIEVRTVA